MSWEKTTVGEIVTTRKGYAFKSSEYVNKGVPVVRVSDYTMDSISDADLKYYPYDEKQNYIDYELHEKDGSRRGRALVDSQHIFISEIHIFRLIRLF